MRGVPFESMLRQSIAILVVLLASACARDPQPPARPNVLLILVDALRADHLGAWGYGRATSKNIDALAVEGVLFERAYAQAPWTKPSIPSLFTALYPIQHGVYEGETPGSAGFLESDVLSDELTTLAEVFRAAGYRTGAFVNNAHLLPQQGFAQGFDVYEHGSLLAPEIERRFFAWLGTDVDRPFFAYLHYLDAHWPFQPPPPFATLFSPPGGYAGVFAQESWRGLRDRINDGRIELDDRDRTELVARHDGAIAAVDAAIGKVLDTLRDRGLRDATVVLLTADHGEELFDHGQVGHGGTLYEEVLHVPLVVRLPGGAGARRVAAPARVIDVFPTLLAAAGIPAPEGIEGRDLLASSAPELEVVAETRHKRTYRIAVRDGDWKYVRTHLASGPRGLAAGRDETFGLVAGMRIKVKGHFGPEGTLEADKITLKEARDDDVELTAPVAAREGAELRVGPFVAAPDRKIGPEDGADLLAGLAVGTWVKLEGEIGEPRRLVFDSIELVPEGDRETELEGLVEGVGASGGEEARLAIAGIEVVVSGDTRIKGGEAPPADPAPDAAERGADEDPFAPARLLSREGLDVTEELYDLARDPAETRDLAREAPADLDRMRARLDAWIGRMAAAGAGRRARRATLDESTVEELKELGYIE